MENCTDVSIRQTAASHDRDDRWMPDLTLCAFGHVASTAALRRLGFTFRHLASAIEAGSVTRVRQGMYTCAHIDESTATASRLGGSLTCVSVLAAAGVWSGHDDRIHIALDPQRSGVGRATTDPRLRLHWHLPRFRAPTASHTTARSLEITQLEALWTAIRCLPEEDAIAALESAIHLGFLTEEEVRRVCVHAPPRLNDGISRMVSTSESGNETIVRLRLGRAGFTVVSQGRVPGMGRNDLVVEDCVDIDVDGRRWHGEDRFAIDRDRDVHVEGLGRRVIRLRASHIHATWPHTLEVISRVVADARRERDRRYGRVIVRATDPLY